MGADPVSGSGTSQIKDLVEKIQGKAETANATSKKPKNELNKDDFTKLMLAQIKYQDPLSPTDNKEMGKQLAQFAQLEQLTNVHDEIEKLRFDQKAADRMSLVSLLGKEVEIDLGRLDHSKGETHAVEFDLPKDTAKVKVTLVDTTGKVVKEQEISQPGGGKYNFNWNGKDGGKQDLPSGTYLIQLSVTDETGKPVAYSTASRGQINGLDFKGNNTFLILKNGNKVNMGQVRSIGEPKKQQGLIADPRVAQTQGQPAQAPRVSPMGMNPVRLNQGEEQKVNLPPQAMAPMVPGSQTESEMKAPTPSANQIPIPEELKQKLLSQIANGGNHG